MAIARRSNIPVLRTRGTKWSAAMNTVFFAAASGLAVGPDAWLEWLSWGWTTGFLVAARMALLVAAAMALTLLVWTIVRSDSSRQGGTHHRR
jgi:hypothetical protein